MHILIHPDIISIIQQQKKSIIVTFILYYIDVLMYFLMYNVLLISHIDKRNM